MDEICHPYTLLVIFCEICIFWFNLEVERKFHKPTNIYLNQTLQVQYSLQSQFQGMFLTVTSCKCQHKFTRTKRNKRIRRKRTTGAHRSLREARIVSMSRITGRRMSDFGCQPPNAPRNFTTFAIEASLIRSSRQISFNFSTFCCAQYFGGRFLIFGAEAFFIGERPHCRAEIEAPNSSSSDLMSQRAKYARVN